MKSIRIAGALIVALLALGVAACGDEEQDDQTRDELVEAANRTCDKFEKRLDEIEEPRNFRSTEQARTYWDEAAPVFESHYIELKALDPNDELEDEWRAFLSRQRELKDVTARIANKAIKGDRSFINDQNEAVRINDDSNGIARRLGARGCVRS